MDPSTRLNHQLKKDVGCKVLQFIQMMKIKKLLGYKTLWCTKQQLLQEKDELGQILSLVTICMNKTLLYTCAIVQPLIVLKIILIYVQGCEKRKPKYTLTDRMKNSSEKLSFINLDRQPSIELAVEPRAKIAFKAQQILAVEL